MTAGIELLWHPTTVINHNGQLMLARFEGFWQSENLRRGDIIRCAYELSVDIDLRWFRAFQEEVNWLSFPC